MGLIQYWQKSKIGQGLAARRFNKRMKKASRILKACAPYQVKQIGTDKNGTVRQIKQVTFDLGHDKFNWKASKVQRGTPSNYTKPKQRK